ncbi:MAG TPA: hypothetical protein VFU60_16215 [Ktedonobacterales bacterium]|nr:hypothetical protein [Ktedonobacterales bacterium]
MWPSQRLMFYTSPRLRGLAAAVRHWATIWAVIVFAEFFFIPSDCMMTSSVDSYSLIASGQRACTSTDIGIRVLLYPAIALAIVLVCLVAVLFFPERNLALIITAQGLKSPSSRFPEAIIGWHAIESLALYRDAARPSPADPYYYLAVTVSLSDGMHDSEVMETVWRQYPRVPDMERVALMLRLERPTDASGKKITAADVLQRIQICFPHEIAENGVEVFEDARLV